MKKCVSCERYISDFDRVCPHCGHVDETMPEPEETAAGTEGPAVSLDKPTVSLEKPASDETARGTAEPETFRTESRPVQAWQGTNGHPMKWHAFLMVVMIIGGILTIINAVGFLTGSIYSREGVEAERVYSVFPGLKSIDMLYGIVSIAIGIFQIVVRNTLNAFRKNGPKFLFILYTAAIISNLVYYFAAASVLKDSAGKEAVAEMNTTIITQTVALVIYAVLNCVYYNKRRDLFVK